jgi:hypothetical protein
VRGIICHLLVLFVDLESVCNEFFVLGGRVIFVEAQAGVEPKLLAMGGMLKSFNLFKIVHWEIHKLPGRLEVLDHKSQVYEVSQLQLAAIHLEVALSAIVVTTL